MEEILIKNPIYSSVPFIHHYYVCVCIYILRVCVCVLQKKLKNS